jgi:hypothetical protein
LSVTVSGPVIDTRTPGVALPPWQPPHPVVAVFRVLPVLPPEDPNAWPDNKNEERTIRRRNWLNVFMHVPRFVVMAI